VPTTNHRGIKPVRSQMVASDIMNTAAIRSAYVLESFSSSIWPNTVTPESPGW